ncbi:hypothetical protein JHK85_007147 [Glycine max]|nr:hypothetical protein JHK85_007147 [Glycine max]KAG5071743.1 hypothetical protein JHK86_006954 [Glycine max]
MHNIIVFHHIPCQEDYLVVPTVSSSFDLKPVNSDDEAPIVDDDMAMEVYNGPPTSQEYGRFLEATLLRTR